MILKKKKTSPVLEYISTSFHCKALTKERVRIGILFSLTSPIFIYQEVEPNKRRAFYFMHSPLPSPLIESRLCTSLIRNVSISLPMFQNFESTTLDGLSEK